MTQFHSCDAGGGVTQGGRVAPGAAASPQCTGHAAHQWICLFPQNLGDVYLLTMICSCIYFPEQPTECQVGTRSPGGLPGEREASAAKHIPCPTDIPQGRRDRSLGKASLLNKRCWAAGDLQADGQGWASPHTTHGS